MMGCDVTRPSTGTQLSISYDMADTDIGSEYMMIDTNNYVHV